MLEDLEKLMPLLYSCMSDPAPVVRRLACITLGQWAVYLQPEILAYHDKLLPKIIEALHDPDNITQERACYALVSFLENLEDEPMIPFVEPIMTRLLTTLRSSKDKNIQDMTISGISAVATIAGEYFIPFYPTVLDLMKQLSQITDFRTIELRGRAIECAGMVAINIGKELFAPHLEFFLQQAKGSLRMGEEVANEIREFIFSFFANLAELAGEDFTVFLPDVLPLVLAGIHCVKPTKPENPLLAGIIGASEYDFQVDNAFIDVKIQALTTLSIFAYKCKNGFIPFIESCVFPIQYFLRYIHPGLRKAAITPAESFMTIVGKAYPCAAGKKWLPGVPVTNQMPSNELKQLLDVFIPIFVDAIAKDPIAEVVIATIDSLNQLTKQFGPSVLEIYHQQIAPVISSILKGGTICQKPDSDSEDEYYDDEGEKEEEGLQILLHGFEFVSTVTHVYQTRWELSLPLVNDVMALLLSEEKKIRREAVGTIAAIVEKLEANCLPQYEVFMEIGVQMMQDTFLPSASNGAYLCSILCLFGPQQALPHFQRMLEPVAKLLNQDKNQKCRDNACGLLGRMISTSPDSLPLDQVLTALITCLPLKKDFAENPTVYIPIVKLIQSQHAAIAPFIPQVVVLFSSQLSEPEDKVSDELKSEMAKTIKFLVQSFPQQMQQICASLTPQQGQNIQQCLQI